MSAIDADRVARLRARLGKPPVEPSGNTAGAVHEHKVEPPQPVALRIAPEPIVEAVQPPKAVSATRAAQEITSPRRPRKDIRSISATGRLVQFSSRITMELDERIREIIERRQEEINAARRGPKYKYGICNFLEEAAHLFEHIQTAED